MDSDLKPTISPHDSDAVCAGRKTVKRLLADGIHPDATCAEGHAHRFNEAPFWAASLSSETQNLEQLANGGCSFPPALNINGTEARIFETACKILAETQTMPCEAIIWILTRAAAHPDFAANAFGRADKAYEALCDFAERSSLRRRFGARNEKTFLPQPRPEEPYLAWIDQLSNCFELLFEAFPQTRQSVVIDGLACGGSWTTLRALLPIKNFDIDKETAQSIGDRRMRASAREKENLFIHAEEIQIARECGELLKKHSIRLDLSQDAAAMDPLGASFSLGAGADPQDARLPPLLSFAQSLLDQSHTRHNDMHSLLALIAQSKKINFQNVHSNTSLCGQILIEAGCLATQKEQRPESGKALCAADLLPAIRMQLAERKHPFGSGLLSSLQTQLGQQADSSDPLAALARQLSVLSEREQLQAATAISDPAQKSRKTL